MALASAATSNRPDVTSTLCETLGALGTQRSIARLRELAREQPGAKAFADRAIDAIRAREGIEPGTLSLAEVGGGELSLTDVPGGELSLHDGS